MKKVIIGLSGIVVLAFAVILFVNAKSGSQEVKKAATEVSKDCAKCPSAATCPSMTENKAAAGSTMTKCDPAKCKAANCDMTKCKEGKCDPAKCTGTCDMKTGEAKTGEAKACDPAACPMAKPVK